MQITYEDKHICTAIEKKISGTSYK